MLQGKNFQNAVNDAFGSLTGCFIGTVCKFGINGIMIYLIDKAIWPDEAINPSKMLFVT